MDMREYSMRENDLMFEMDNVNKMLLLYAYIYI